MDIMTASKRRKKLSLILLVVILVGWSLFHNFRFLYKQPHVRDHYNDVVTMDAPFVSQNTTYNSNDPIIETIDKKARLPRHREPSDSYYNITEDENGFTYLNTSQLVKKVRIRQDRFKPEYAPFMLDTEYFNHPNPQNPIRVRVLLFEGPKISFRPTEGNSTISHLLGDEVLNIAMDGFQISPYFQTVGVTTIPKNKPKFFIEESPDQDIVWIIEMRLMEDEKRISIPEQVLELAKRTREYQKQQVSQNANFSLRQNLPLLRVILMDYRDRLHNLCFRRKGQSIKDLVDFLGPANVREMRQQFITGRKWDANTNFPKLGYATIVGFQTCWDYMPIHAPYTVRSDYANHVSKVYANYLPDDKDDNKVERDTSPADTVRRIDVAHFWSKGQRGQRDCLLRDAVTDVVLSLGAHAIQSRPIQVIGDFVSTSGSVGRTAKQDSYINALLTTKIVVVAQRDSWEDHYRLFESVIGGALVMTDPMITLPTGLINGTNIIIYESLENLRSLILYYLEHEQERIDIAHNGWELAMNHHRTYHWMERLFFGKQLSK